MIMLTILISCRFIEGLVEDNAKDKDEVKLLPSLLQRKANKGEAQQSQTLADDVRGGKRGASIGEGWLRETSGSPEKVQEVLLGFVSNDTRPRTSEKKRNTFKAEIVKNKNIQEEEVQIGSGQDNPQNGNTIRSTQAPKYQIVYKSTHDNKNTPNKISTHNTKSTPNTKSTKNNKSTPNKKSTRGNEGDNDKSQPGAVVPSPRGHKSFFDEEKIRKFQLLAQKKAPPKLQFGFQPIKKKPKTVFGKSTSTSDYDGFLDSLQAPRVLRQRPRSPAATRKSKSLAKQDRKSNLDFLGIFDTRQYFYIPNRRSDEAKTKRSKNSGVLAKIVRLIIGQ